MPYKRGKGQYCSARPVPAACFGDSSIELVVNFRVLFDGHLIRLGAASMTAQHSRQVEHLRTAPWWRTTDFLISLRRAA